MDKSLIDLRAKVFPLNRTLALHLLVTATTFLDTDRPAAQIFETLYSFSPVDGNNPAGQLGLDHDRFYGTTKYGGVFDQGTVYLMSRDGTGFSTLHEFLGGYDGAVPSGGLTISSDVLYGTAQFLGLYGYGTVYSVYTDGSGFTVLHDFSGGDGGGPTTPLLSASNVLFGMTLSGGNLLGDGTVFRLDVGGQRFTNLFAFNRGTNGANPWSNLVISSNRLFGTAQNFGMGANGTVFSIRTDGDDMRVLHAFSVLTNGTNDDGALPSGALALSGDYLFGATTGGGSFGKGCVFRVRTDGSQLMTLHHFRGSDGAIPAAGLTLADNYLYGTTVAGGDSDNGTVYSLRTDGREFASLHTFGGGMTNTDGSKPLSPLIFADNVLYGTSSGGGSWGRGTIFKLTLPAPPPSLRIISTGGNVVLNWPTNAVGFNLQSTTNLASPLWIVDLSPRVIVDGQNAVTNSISGAQRFFRLSK